MPRLRGFLILAALGPIIGCTQIPTVNCPGLNPDCYVNGALTVVNWIDADITTWYIIQLSMVLIAGIAGIIATICLALQDSDNSHITKPIGITATALVTGMTALATSLHITDNIDKLIEIRLDMNSTLNTFIHESHDVNNN
jgi:hypothetical protein